MRKFLNTVFDSPVGRRCITGWCLVGIVVCGAWTITYLSLGMYTDAGAFAFFTVANLAGFLLYRNRRR